MRILVIGAGVIGSNLAADLFASGRDVTILARGEWADTLESDGLVIDPIFSPGKKKYRIPVIRELKKDDIYDVVFAVMRYTQIESLIPDLADNGSKNIAFVGNNLSPEAFVAKFPGKNVLFGFSMAAGHREKDRVVSISLHKITIGQLKDARSNERLIREIFAGTKVKAVYQPNMGDYLLCHAAFVTPVAFANCSKTTFIYGSDETLYACAPSFEAAMKKYKVDYEMIIGEGMFHCYPVFPICKEAKDGWNMMVRLMKENMDIKQRTGVKE